MTILGPNAGIDPRGAPSGGGVRGPEAIIDGMGMETAIAFASSGITLDGFTIQGGCCDALQSGLHMGGGYDDNHVLNNIVRDNSIGIFANCGGPLPTEIRHNLIDSNNRPSPAGGSGIYVDGSVNLQIIENELKGHVSNNPPLIGATAAGSHTSLLVDGNNIHDNACGCSAIYALGIGGGTFSRNQILAENSVIRLGDADSDIDVKNNLFISATVDVRVVDDGYFLDPPANTMPFPVNSNVHINGNSFGAMSASAVANQGGYITPPLDASANWWGDSTLAGVQAKLDISGGPIDFTPWLDTGIEPVPNVCDGSQGDFHTLHVDDDSPQSGATGRIQEGINLISGSTVLLGPGTYDENAIINVNNLNLVGAGHGITIIRPAVSNPDCNTGGGGFLCGGAARVIILVRVNNATNHGMTLEVTIPT